jgi:hypothetical protein
VINSLWWLAVALKPPASTLRRPYRSLCHLRGVCAPYRHCSTIKHVRLGNTHVGWECACLAARSCQLRLSLFLRPAALRESWDTWRHQSPPQRGSGVWSYGAYGGTGAILSREARSGAARDVAAPEPSSSGGGVWSYWTRSSTKAVLNREAGTRATRHMVAAESSSAGRRGLEVLNTW